MQQAASRPHSSEEGILWMASVASVIIHGVALACFSASTINPALSTPSKNLLASIRVPIKNDLSSSQSALVSIAGKDIWGAQMREPFPSIPISTKKKNVAAIDTYAEHSQKHDLTQPRELSTVPFFFPTHVLGRPALPITAPDPKKFLSGKEFPALPFKLRLYIDAAGRVVRVVGLEIEMFDERLLQPVIEMFYATRFIPGGHEGKDVPSFMDIEIELSDFLGQ